MTDDGGGGLFGLEGRRLLVVDDDPRCAEAVRTWLEICGARVTVAHSVAAARAALDATEPELVLLDVFLPDGTAWDVVREIGGRVPVIAITGGAGTLACGPAATHGVRHVLSKPIAPGALASALSECLAEAA
jgi:two-component system OmpR family response regulator